MWRSAVQVCLGLLLITSQEAEVGHILPRATSGGLAQLARASALQAEGQRFESVILHLAMSYDIERSMTICDRQYADGKKLSAASKK